MACGVWISLALAFMIPLALGNATSVLVGQALGRGQPERARHICWEGIRLGLSIALVLCLAFWLGAIASIWLVGIMMAVYLNYTAKKHLPN